MFESFTMRPSMSVTPPRCIKVGVVVRPVRKPSLKASSISLMSAESRYNSILGFWFKGNVKLSWNDFPVSVFHLNSVQLQQWFKEFFQVVYTQLACGIAQRLVGVRMRFNKHAVNPGGDSCS